MRLNNRFYEVFDNTPILGMIHLAGRNPVKRAVEEIAVFEEEGIDGAIVENYHGTLDDVVETLKVFSRIKTKVVIGINVLPNEFHISLPLAYKYNADFVQIDHVAGKYFEGKLDFRSYSNFKERFLDIIVMGGVHPKYFTPIPGSNLRKDLEQGMHRAEAIVVTGEGTGMKTPLDKIKLFRKVIGEYPLIIGAGLTPENAYEQLCIGDGAIVGTCFKINNKTKEKMDKSRIKDFMDVVKQARAYKNST